MLIGIEATHANQADRTGVEEYCWQMIQEFKKIIPSSVRVVLYSDQPLRGELGLLPQNWQVKVLSWPFKKGWSQVRLSLEFLFYPPDVFFAPGQLVPLICPKQTVVMIHDSAFLVFPNAYNFLGRQYLKLMNKLILRKAKLIIASSEFNKRELLRLYGKKIENKIKVVPLAYDDKRFVIARSEATWLRRSVDMLRKYHIMKPYIISIGRLEEKKNTKRIVEAFNLIKSQLRTPNSELQLVLIGKPGVGYEEIKAEIERSPDRENIIHPGYVSPEDLPTLLSAAEAFVFPSLYEGFGIPLLEAMASGCPVVTSRGSALEEVGGNAAVYVDPSSVEDIAKAIETILSNKEKKEQMVEAGLTRVKQFSWEKTADKTWQEIAKM